MEAYHFERICSVHTSAPCAQRTTYHGLKAEEEMQDDLVVAGDGLVVHLQEHGILRYGPLSIAFNTNTQLWVVMN